MFKRRVYIQKKRCSRPLTFYQRQRKDVKSGEVDCGVCLEPFNKDLIFLKCYHPFHIECFQKSLTITKKNVCPTCKEEIDSCKNGVNDILLHPWPDRTFEQLLYISLENKNKLTIFHHHQPTDNDENIYFLFSKTYEGRDWEKIDKLIRLSTEKAVAVISSIRNNKNVAHELYNKIKPRMMVNPELLWPSFVLYP